MEATPSQGDAWKALSQPPADLSLAGGGTTVLRCQGGRGAAEAAALPARVDAAAGYTVERGRDVAGCAGCGVCDAARGGVWG